MSEKTVTASEIISVQQPLMLARLDAQALISQALSVGANVETLERLVALAKDMRAELAREAWYAAMVEFQRTCPAVKKTSSAKIMTRGGGAYGYWFAPLDAIMSTILPVMGRLGLSVAWRSRIEANQVAVECVVSHTLGHQEGSGEIVMPVMPGDTGANPAQRVGISLTYAKRYALLGVTGLAPEDDDDARHRDEVITGVEKKTSNKGKTRDAVRSEEADEQERRPSPVIDTETGEVFDRLVPPDDAPEAERAALCDAIKELSVRLKLPYDVRTQAAKTYLGGSTLATADLAALSGLLGWLRARAGE